ncbi:hypothetical protein EHV15_35565 [Paenibacillus oralis]|uniref:Uncharacterized protein n=1 Tax=Paenibacillus oralis TaxID=2490856 RepID=A0A3P3TAH3_9BACL|nr:hypothetical protein [Paenibacillus oralis]RRJ54892.1 hypothetical protein EHV15_35565 [Paenibacillus oralis]
MNKALFFGASDISDLLQYVSKVIAASGKKVLLVDGTNEKYIQYGTPIPSSKLKIVEFESFDVGIDFSSFNELESFLEKNQQYDLLIVHCDKSSFIKKEDLNKFEFKYVATSSEKMSIDKTVDAITSILEQDYHTDENTTKMLFTEIFVNYVEVNMAQDYLEMILEKLPITWSEEPYELFFDEVDYSTKINNQHEGKINIRRLSRNYKKVVQQISEEISGLEDKEVKLAIKQIMRRSFAWGK